jgi:hypothetical protein
MGLLRRVEKITHVGRSTLASSYRTDMRIRPRPYLTGCSWLLCTSDVLRSVSRRPCGPFWDNG